MKPSAVAKFKSITDVLAPDQARTFLELVRIVQQQTDQETISIQDDAGEVFGFLVLPVFHASPDDPPTDPEFLKELERRLQSPAGPVTLIEDGMDLEDLLEGEQEPE